MKRKLNFWDGTSYKWHKRQTLYAVIYLGAAAIFMYYGKYTEALLALLLGETRLSRKEQQYG